jgi:hypothetical protein
MPSWEEFLAGEVAHIPILEFLANLALAGLLAFALGMIYQRYGDSLSNRAMFARNFVIIGMTTMLIISVVKSSLALSLGLVGALSIIRFRAAIKEPEELAYLFLAISIGLGLGANQRLITVVAFCAIAAIIIAKKRFLHRQQDNQNLHLTVSSHNPGRIDLQQIVTILKKHCKAVDLKRFDETKEVLEASFLVDLRGYDQIEKMKGELAGLSESVKITFLDYRGTY